MKMTPEEHYEEAEKFLEYVDTEHDIMPEKRMELIARAHVHAILSTSKAPYPVSPSEAVDDDDRP